MLKSFLRSVVNRALQPIDIMIIRRPKTRPKPEPKPLASLLEHHAINTVIDVGANEGQFGLELRQDGFRGLLISLEPSALVYEKLQANASQNPPWETIRCAAGASGGVIDLHIAGNSLSSSLLPMTPRHESAAPESKYVGNERVELTTLDSLLLPRLGELGRIFVKLDVQGYEGQVLEGSQAVLRRAVGVMLETSLVACYAGSMGFSDTLQRMATEGFMLQHVQRVFWDPQTQQALQLDCTFFRENSPSDARP